MNMKVRDLMVSNVMTTYPEQLIERVKKTMNQHHIHCIPVVDDDDIPIGIITSSDILTNRADRRPVKNYMTQKVYTISPYADASLAARMMRNHGCHHLVVTHEQQIVGIISSFDLLQLVEDHRFVMKTAPTPTKKPTGRRSKLEASANGK